MSVSDVPLFSVIIPTRNRASLCSTALASVCGQTFRDLEIIVVDDGSNEEQRLRYSEINKTDDRAQALYLASTETGHGPSFCINYGVSKARGRYLCFLDDDDQWIDSEHLSRVSSVIENSRGGPDVVLANQRAYRDGVAIKDVTWIEDLESRLGRTPDITGAYTVTLVELLKCRGHCHRNTTIVSRAYYNQLGGLDEEMRYEEDRDFYLRAVDRAKTIKFLPFTVSRHNIPSTSSSASNGRSVDDKRLMQLRVLDKAILFGMHQELRRYAMLHRGYVLKHIAKEMERTGRFDCAIYYARQALVAQFTLGWFASTILVGIKAMMRRRKQEGPTRAHDLAS